MANEMEILLQHLDKLHQEGMKTLDDWVGNEGIGEAEKSELDKLGGLIIAQVARIETEPNYSPKHFSQGIAFILQAAFQLGRIKGGRK